MEILSVMDPLFQQYGRIVTGCDDALAALTAMLRPMFPLPEAGLGYQPSVPALEQSPACEALTDILFGGLPAQFGCCYGRNARLNCLEYHRDSEYNLSDEDFILLLAKQTEMEGNTIDTARVKAFRVPAGMMVEIFATTLHYAPCHTDREKGFRVLAAMSKGSNTDRPTLRTQGYDSPLLWARNKWLMAHPDSPEAKAGAYVGIVGENIDLDNL